MPASSPRRSRRRIAVRVGVGLLVVVLAVVALLAWQGWRAYRDGQQANADLATFRERLLDRDIPGAREALADAQQSSGSARSAIDGPLWGLATALPGVGSDVSAVRDLTSVVDDVTQGALPAAMTALSFADPRDIGLQDGRVQLGPIRQASGQLNRAAELLRSADDDAAAISTDGVAAALTDRIVEAQGQLDQTARLATSAAAAGELLPGMLGGDGARNYLVLAQNNAEQRSLGGLVGAMVELRADDGRLRLVRQVVPADFGSFEQPVVRLTDAERAIYGDVLGRFPGNVTNAPDFPRAAQLIKAMWEDRIGGRLDGVAAVDPWALQLILQVVGPVETDAGRLNGDNAARRLLVDVYAEVPDLAEQNRVFAQAARAVFDAVRGFGGDQRALTRALAQGVDEGRIMVWSAKDREQEVLASTRLGRTLADATPSSPQVGVYLQDLTQSKMSTYQRVRVDVRPQECAANGSARVDVKVTLRSTAPVDRDLPISVTGDGSQGVPLGDMRTRAAVYAPPGWTFESFRSSDGRRDVTTYTDQGLLVGFRDFELSPEERESVTLTLVGEPSVQNWGVRYTPGTRPANVRIDVSGC